MDNEKEIQRLKERLTSVENQLQHKSQFSTILKFVIIFIIVFIVFLMSIGIVQFMSDSST